MTCSYKLKIRRTRGRERVEVLSLPDRSCVNYSELPRWFYRYVEFMPFSIRRKMEEELRRRGAIVVEAEEVWFYGQKNELGVPVVYIWHPRIVESVPEPE